MHIIHFSSFHKLGSLACSDMINHEAINSEDILRDSLEAGSAHHKWYNADKFHSSGYRKFLEQKKWSELLHYGPAYSYNLNQHYTCNSSLMFGDNGWFTTLQLFSIISIVLTFQKLTIFTSSDIWLLTDLFYLWY